MRLWQIPLCTALLTLLPSAFALGEEAEEKKITFEEHIKPIFREHCTACHSESDKESDLALDTYSATLAGGSSGEVISEGNSSSSRIVALMTHAERPYMPPDQDPIPKDQIQLVKTWIEQGMPENSGSKIKRFNTAASAMLSNVSVGKPDGPPPMPAAVLREPVSVTSRSAAISAMAASPWAPLVAVGGQQQVSLYHAESGQLLGIVPFPEGEPQVLTFTRDGKQLLIAGGQHSHSGCAVLVDVESGARITKVGDELDIVLAADISPDKSRIAIAGPQKIIRIFDSVSGDKVTEMKKHTDWINCLRYSPDGVLLASGDRSNGLIVWEADTGRLYSELPGHKGAVRAVDFRGDSNVLASASLDGTVKLWDMFESKEIKSWGAHGGGATSVVFAHNGMLATAGRDSRVKTWNGNGEVQQQFTGLSETALEVAMTGDGARVAGGDWNGKVQIWAATDPKQTQLIAANPPSIETRLASAREQLKLVAQELERANSDASKAEGLAVDGKKELDSANAEFQQLQQQVTQEQKQAAELNTQVTGLDARIAELQSELAGLNEQRKTASTSLQGVKAALAQHQQMLGATEQKKTELAKQHVELAKTAQESAARRDEATRRFDAAKTAVTDAENDLAAVEARAKQLRESAATTQSQVETLSASLATHDAAVEQQKSEATAIATQLAELNAKLAELQKLVNDAQATQVSSTSALEAAQKASATIKAQLEAAEQSAADAQEKLKLFEQSYRKPE